MDEPNNGRKAATDFNSNSPPNFPTSEGLWAPADSLHKGASNKDSRLKPEAAMAGLKLDLAAEVHLVARIRGDIVIALC